MSLQRKTYDEIRVCMKPGDVIAFGGKGLGSAIIKGVTESNVSHVGVIVQSRLLIDGELQDDFFNQVMESTKLDGYAAVMMTRLSDRLRAYKGEMWWLRLREDIRSQLNSRRFFDFLLRHDGKPYDLPQAIKSRVDFADGIGWTRNQEDFEKLFCSELVAGALEAGGVITKVNASEVTPIDLCRFNIYANEYIQFNGEEKEISHFSSVDPTGWGQ